MKKIFGSVVLLSTILFLAAGCSSGNNEEKSANSGRTTLKVTTWNYDGIPEFKALFEAFEKENPEIKIEPVDIPADDYGTKVTTMLSSGDTTDILTMKDMLTYADYAQRDQLMDLSDHIAKSDLGPAKDSYDMYEIDGKTFAQPYRTDYWVLYYNKKMFDEAGLAYPDNLTWDEYESLAEKLSKKDGQTYGTYQQPWRNTIQIVATAQNDKDWLNPQYDYFKPYYDRVLRMQENKAQMDFGTAKSTKVTYASQFEGGNAAMMYMGTWYIGMLRDSIAQGKTDVEWGIAQLPQQEKGKVTTFGNPTGFAINKASKNAEAAQKFLDFASGEKGAMVLAEIGVLPSYLSNDVSDSYFGQEGMPTDELSKAAFKPDTIFVDKPKGTVSATVEKILTEEHDLILVGDESTDKGISNMEKRVAQELE